MVAIKKTNEIINDSNLAKNNSYIFISRYGTQIIIDWKHYENTLWEKYQIKETDYRQKTATFTSPQYIDLTTGVYAILITSNLHECFSGRLISVDYDKETGLYEYQCQDNSRAYQSKFELINHGKVSLHRVLKFLITRGGISTVGAVSKAKLNEWSKVLSGLRPAYQYEQKYYGSIVNFNPMTHKNQMIIRNKSFIEAIRDLVLGTGAYIDVYFDKYGVLQIEPYHINDFLNTGLFLTTPEIASAEYTFDTTNVITGVVVHNTDKTKTGKGYSSKDLINLNLSAFFGKLVTSIDNPNQSNTNSTSTSSKKSTNTKKNINPYGTKKKIVYLNIDNIDGVKADKKKLNTMKDLLKKQGWTVKIIGVGPSTHYKRRSEVKKGIWFCLYGGACAGTLKEHCTSSWFLNPLKKNKSRVVVGFFPPAGKITHGGKYYKYLGPAHDWSGSRSYARMNYPAKFLSKAGVPFMYAKDAKEMVSKFLAGGDNYKTSGNSYKWHDSWQKHNVKWI